MTKIRKATINGKKYKIKWQKIENSYVINGKGRRKYIPTLGLCDWEDKTIYINPNQTDRELVLTAIHEIIGHAYHPRWTEDKVERFEGEIEELLKKLGVKF